MKAIHVLADQEFQDADSLQPQKCHVSFGGPGILKGGVKFWGKPLLFHSPDTIRPPAAKGQEETITEISGSATMLVNACQAPSVLNKGQILLDIFVQNAHRASRFNIKTMCKMEKVVSAGYRTRQEWKGHDRMIPAGRMTSRKPSLDRRWTRMRCCSPPTPLCLLPTAFT